MEEDKKKMKPVKKKKKKKRGELRRHEHTLSVWFMLHHTERPKWGREGSADRKGKKCKLF